MTRDLDDCKNGLTRAGLTAREAGQVVDDLAAVRDRAARTGDPEGIENAVRKSALDRAQRMEMNARLQRKHAALNIVKRRSLDQRLARYIADTGDPKEAFLAILEGSPKRGFGASQSVFARYCSLAQGWQNAMELELSRIPNAAGLLKRDREFMRNVVREMFHELDGRTGDKTARQVAEVFGKYAEASRTRLNAAGAWIGKLPGWVPQSHDEGAMLKRGADAWIDFTLSRLDTERTFPDIADEKEMRRILGEVYQNIVSGRHRGVTAAEQGQFLGPRNLARGMGKERILHFRDADAWLEYHDNFGTGNLYTAMDRHLDRSARKLALMEMLGPNPETMLTSLLESQRRRIREDAALSPEQKNKLEKRLEGQDPARRHGAIGNALAEVMGETLMPEKVSLAKFGSYTRAVQSMAKLGGATISAISDLLTYAMHQRHLGRNMLHGYYDALTSLAATRGAEGKEILHHLAVITDGMLGDAVARWSAQDNLSGFAADQMNRFFRWSGLTWWTNRMKAGAAMSISNEFARASAKGWGEISESMRAILTRHGIDERTWDAIRASKARAADGRDYLTPDRMLELDDAAMDRFLADEIDAKRAQLMTRNVKGQSVAVKTKEAINRRTDQLNEWLTRRRSQARQELETMWRSLIIDETRNAVIEPDARTRRVMVQGTRPGTATGEAIRFVSQFKSFPIAYYQRVLRRGAMRVPGKGADVAGMAHYLVGALTLGYITMTAKDLSKGRAPRDPRKLETWFAAAVQSGGAGIYGDFLFAQYNRFGGGPVSTAAGPTAGTAGDLIQIASGLLRGEADAGDLLYLGLNNAPYLNLWYTRAALDYGVLFHLREMVSPGTLRRMERRMEKEWGQEYMVPPSEVVRRGGGFQ